MSASEYAERLCRGWRRFGRTVFRPRCAHCAACQSLRVPVQRFRPDRSQRRVHKANAGRVQLRIGEPTVTREMRDLYARFHEFQSETKGWPEHEDDPAAYCETFLDHPFPTQEWRYELDGRLVGVGYVDDLPVGLSAIYFYYDPDVRTLGLGTWNVLSMIARAAERGLPHVYLGYYVADCQSLAYKARFRANQILSSDGTWREFQS
jgi:arginine-tRNA-protein transferase